MPNFLRLSIVLALALPSMVACASSDTPVDDGAADENFTAAADASSDIITALKKANRTSLLPSKTVAWVYAPGAMNAVVLKQAYPGTDRAGTTEFASARDMLKTRGFTIVGKTAPYRDCEFTGKNDYLAKVSGVTFLTTNMTAVNSAIGENVYSAADFATAKSIEASITYKLVLTKEHLSVYLGKQGSTWKIVAMDASEYSCEA